MGHRPSHPRLKWNVLKVLRHLSKIRITSRSTRHIRLFSCNLFIHLLTWLDSLVNVLHPRCSVTAFDTDWITVDSDTIWQNMFVLIRYFLAKVELKGTLTKCFIIAVSPARSIIMYEIHAWFSNWYRGRCRSNCSCWISSATIGSSNHP